MNGSKKDDAQMIIFFDGECILCNSFFQVLLKQDKKHRFKFATLQSSLGQELKESIKEEAFDSFILKEGEKLTFKSDAVFIIASKLPFPWPLIQVGYIVPRFLRDKVYDWVAKNRFKWFGRSENCIVLDSSDKARFIS